MARYGIVAPKAYGVSVGIGRRNLALNAACVSLARRLASSKDDSARWVGRDALRKLTCRKVRAQLTRRNA